MKIFGIKMKKSFYKFLNYFMIIVCLFLISYILFYYRFQNIIIQEINDNEQQTVNRIGKDMDRNVYDVLKLVYQSKNDYDLYRIDEKDYISCFDYLALQRFISRNIITNSFIDDIIFYVKDSNYIISKEGSFNFNTFFDRYMIHPSKNKYYWKNYFNNLNIHGRVQTTVFSADTYLSRNFPDQIVERNLIILAADCLMFDNIRFLVLIDTDKIDNLCGRDYIIFDKELKKIIYNSNSYNINISRVLDNIDIKESGLKIKSSDNNCYYAYYTKSVNYNWLYIKIIPEDIIYNSLKNYNRITMIIIILSFAVTIILSYYFSKNLYKPIKKIVDLINPIEESNINNDTDTQKIYDYINHAYSNYVTMEQKLELVQKIYKEYFYDRLIRNADVDIGENMLNELNIKKDNFNSFLIINFRIRYRNKFDKMSSAVPDIYHRMDIVVKELIDIIVNDMGMENYTFKIDKNSYISIITLTQEKFNGELFQNKVNKILANDYDYLYLLFSKSRIYKGIDNLKAAYEESIHLNQYCSLKQENQFISYEKVNNINKFLIPRRIIDKIKSLLELGKLDEVRQYMIEIVGYFEKKEIPLLFIKKYFVTVFNELIAGYDSKSLKSKSIDRFYLEIDKCQSREELEQLLDNVDSVVEYNFIQQKKLYRDSIAAKMAEYIKENYHKDLCLDMFANMFDMSPIYLSKLFKDHNGINFSEFVNRIRINNAKKILEEQKIKIKDLSVTVGYRDSNTFIKVFKGFTGVSPGEYRKLKRFENGSKR